MHLICCLLYTILSGLTPNSSAVHMFDQSCGFFNEVISSERLCLELFYYLELSGM